MDDKFSALGDLPTFALDQVSDAIVITEPDLARAGGPRIIYVNQAMLKMTGYCREEVIGQSPKIFQGKDTDQDVAKRIITSLRAGDLVIETILNYAKDGTPYWTELNISPLRDDAGQIIAYLSIQHDLTQLRDAQERHQRDLRLIANGEKIARVGSWGYDLEERKVFWSDGTYGIWEWDRSEPLPSMDEWLTFVDESDQPMMSAMLDACIKTQTPYHAEVRAHTRRGKPLHLEVLGEAMIDEGGRTTAIFGAVRDISLEKRLEAKLDETISNNQETEQYFAIARTIAKIGVFDYWIDHDRLHWSDELFAMTGLSPSLFPAKADVFLSRIDAKHKLGYRRLIAASNKEGKSYSTTIRFDRSDGKAVYMAMIAEVRESPYGPRVVGIVRDVTSDVEAAQRLSREQERFRIIADCVSDVLWDFDFTPQGFWITPDWPRRLGVDLPSSGDPTQWLEYVAPEHSSDLVQSITQALGSDDHRWKCEFALVDPQGTKVEVEVNATILRTAEGKAQRILGNCRDITVEKRQREGFTRSRALEAVGQMTGGIAHDFNNLLMIIQGNAELLEFSELGEDDNESVSLIMQAAEAAASLTARLLSFSGQSELRHVLVDAGALVEDVAGLLRSGLTQSITLTTRIQSGLWLIEVDGRALEQAVINLAVNARDAIGRSGGRVEIACENAVVTDEMIGGHSGLAAGRYVRIGVSDNGSGMSEAVRSRAFEPFFTTKDVGKGTGLGLSTVYGFASQSGGTVQIYSEEGQGTTVNLYMPACAEAVPKTETPTPTAVGLVNSGQHILLVEDQFEVRSHVEHLLINAGFAVTSAEHAKAALAILEQGEQFDLLFTDIIMPGGMNGVQLSEAARVLVPTLKVLFTSGFPASAFDEFGLTQHQDFELLKKPYKRADLMQAIARALEL